MYILDRWTDEFAPMASVGPSKVAQHSMIYLDRGKAVVNGQEMAAGDSCYLEDYAEVDAGEEGAVLWRWGLDRQDSPPRALNGKDVRSKPVMNRRITMLELFPMSSWLMRLDQIIGFEGTTGLHGHPGSGIRSLLSGSVKVESPRGEESVSEKRGDCWYEEGSIPLTTTSLKNDPVTFLRCMVLPPEYEGSGDTANWISGFDGKLEGTKCFRDVIVRLR